MPSCRRGTVSHHASSDTWTSFRSSPRTSSTSLGWIMLSLMLCCESITFLAPFHFSGAVSTTGRRATPPAPVGHITQLHKVPIPGTTTELFCDTCSDRPRPFITSPFRRQVFMSLHNLSHIGAKASAKLVSKRFVWSVIRKDCRL